MKPGYKKKATSSKKKIAKQKRKDSKQSVVMSKATDVVLDVEEPAAMGMLPFSFLEVGLLQFISSRIEVCRVIITAA
jgi:hypothetical protein